MISKASPIACADAELLFRTADVTAAMSVEALLGTDRAFQAHLHEIRPHKGQVASAANLVALLRGSEIVASHKNSNHAVQDAYSVRCSPQVAGAARDTLDFARGVASVELASAIDNPVVVSTGFSNPGPKCCWPIRAQRSRPTSVH